jgi:hypothetical protein
MAKWPQVMKEMLFPLIYGWQEDARFEARFKEAQSRIEEEFRELLKENYQKIREDDVK